MQFTEWGIGRTELWADLKEIGSGGSSAPMFTGRPVCVYMGGGTFLPVVIQLLPNYREVTNWN